MWFTFVTARLFIFLRFQPRLTATLWRAISVVNSPIRRAGLAPACRPASLAQASLFPVVMGATGTKPRLVGHCNSSFEELICRRGPEGHYSINRAYPVLAHL